MLKKKKKYLQGPYVRWWKGPRIGQIGKFEFNLIPSSPNSDQQMSPQKSTEAANISKFV